MLVLILLALSAGSALALVEYDMYKAEDLFEQFIKDYNRVYKDVQEKQMRFEIFKASLQEINESNRKHGYNVMGISNFADLSEEEFSSQYLGLLPEEGSGTPCKPDFSMNLKKSKEELPENFDWRDKGVLNAVKNQQGCGSCWAFSTIANVESQYGILHGANNLLRLSEQQLVDCDKKDLGCDGGLMSTAILYLMTSGVMAEADYPYQAVQGKCKLDPGKVKVNVTGCVNYTIPSSSQEDDIRAILVENGPLTIGLASAPFRYYQQGVFKGCVANAKISHALLLVGYGTDKITKEPYWIIRNSWGKAFGEEGYLRMIRGNPACAVGIYDLISAKVA